MRSPRYRNDPSAVWIDRGIAAAHHRWAMHPHSITVWPPRRLLAVAFVAAILVQAEAGMICGFTNVLSPEPADAQALRHQLVAARRSGPMVIVHRGMWAAAPENTIEAYAAAMDYGADGCEIDIRRTADGVLVLFHDDTIERMTGAFGSVNQLTYHELLTLGFRQPHGRATSHTKAPTLAAVLALARQRAMLLHLDIKEAGLETEIAQLLDAADVWDHVVSVNTANATNLLKSPRLKLLPYKTGLYERRRDVDPASVRANLSAPGQMIIVDDPRVAAMELKRPAFRPVPLPGGLSAEWKAVRAVAPVPSTNVAPPSYVAEVAKRVRGKSLSALVALLSTNDFAECAGVHGDERFHRRRTERILERAWVAQRIAELRPRRTPELVKLLEFYALNPALHADWMFHGLDGAIAVRTLATIGSTASVPVIVASFKRVRPELERVAGPWMKGHPIGWVDWRKSYSFPALGELRCAASQEFLIEYVNADESIVNPWCFPQFEEATKALMNQRLTRDEIVALLRHPNLAVRGTAVLTCVDHPTRVRRAALKLAAPWAGRLPRAR